MSFFSASRVQSGRRVFQFAAIIFAAATLPLISFAQAPSGAIHGQVTDHMGAHIPGVVVSITGTGRFSAEIQTDRDGRFLMTGLAAGTYRVKIPAAPPFGEIEESVVIIGDVVAEITMTLGRGCGKASDAGGGVREVELAEIVRQAVERAVEKLGVPTGGDQPVLMSTANVNPDWLVGIESLNLKLIFDGQIRETASAGQAVKVLRITEIRTGKSCASVALVYGPPLGKGSSRDETGEVGVTLEYRKNNDRWEERTVLEAVL